MKERRERGLAEILEDRDLDFAIRDRFNSERHPEESVDGDSRWGELPGMWDESDFEGEGYWAQEDRD